MLERTEEGMPIDTVVASMFKLSNQVIDRSSFSWLLSMSFQSITKDIDIFMPYNKQAPVLIVNHV